VGAQTISLLEDFAADPASGGWGMHGNTSLFQWDPANQNLTVRWDSSQTNSYFYHPLGVTLGMEDDFTVSFDLAIQEATITGYGFELAVGLLNLADATQPGFLRGTGNDSPNLVEFDYFPDPEGTLDWGPSLTTMMADSVGIGFSHWSKGGYAPAGLAPQDVFHVEMAYSGNNHRLRTTVTNITSGGIVEPFSEAYLPATFVGFRVDHLVIASYSDQNSWGSLLANGTVDNVRVAASPIPVARLRGEFASPGVWQMHFLTHTNWRYTLERTTNLLDWRAVSETRQGNENDMTLQDTNAPANRAFYRVRAD